MTCEKPRTPDILRTARSSYLIQSFIAFSHGLRCHCFFFFFFNDTAPPDIYPLPLHDALPISPVARVEHEVGRRHRRRHAVRAAARVPRRVAPVLAPGAHVVEVIEQTPVLDQPRAAARRSLRSEEHTSELQSQSKLVCRLLLDK